MMAYEHLVVEGSAVVTLDIKESGAMRIEIEAKGERLVVEVEHLERLELVE